MTPDVGFYFVSECKCKMLYNSGICYVQVNGTQACIYRTFKHHLVVILEVLFHNEIIYEMGPPMSEKYVKESQSRATPPLFSQLGVGA